MSIKLLEFLAVMAYFAIGILFTSILCEVTESDNAICCLVIFIWPILLVIGILVVLVLVIPSILGSKIGHFIKNGTKSKK